MWGGCGLQLGAEAAAAGCSGGDTIHELEGLKVSRHWLRRVHSDKHGFMGGMRAIAGEGSDTQCCVWVFFLPMFFRLDGAVERWWTIAIGVNLMMCCSLSSTELQGMRKEVVCFVKLPVPHVGAAHQLQYPGATAGGYGDPPALRTYRFLPQSCMKLSSAALLRLVYQWTGLVFEGSWQLFFP